MRGILFDLSAEKLIVEASPDDVARFAVGMPVGVSPLGPLAPADAVTLPGETLYDSKGRPVAIVRSVIREAANIDVTTFGDLGQQFVRGVQSWRLDVDPLF